jgi:hypothetical protein
MVTNHAAIKFETKVTGRLRYTSGYGFILVLILRSASALSALRPAGGGGGGGGGGPWQAFQRPSAAAEGGFDETCGGCTRACDGEGWGEIGGKERKMCSDSGVHQVCLRVAGVSCQFFHFFVACDSKFSIQKFKNLKKSEQISRN